MPLLSIVVEGCGDESRAAVLKGGWQCQDSRLEADGRRKRADRQGRARGRGGHAGDYIPYCTWPAEHVAQVAPRPRTRPRHSQDILLQACQPWAEQETTRRPWKTRRPAQHGRCRQDNHTHTDRQALSMQATHARPRVTWAAPPTPLVHVPEAPQDPKPNRDKDGPGAATRVQTDRVSICLPHLRGTCTFRGQSRGRGPRLLLGLIALIPTSADVRCSKQVSKHSRATACKFSCQGTAGDQGLSHPCADGCLEEPHAAAAAMQVSSV